MKKTLVILQSNYIPWKGYFDLIHLADELIVFDDVQYTRRDWRNRNIIKTPKGLQWLTIPVHVKGRYHQKIRDTAVCDPRWARKHWTALVHNYSKAPGFAQYRERFEELYLHTDETALSEINLRFIKAICQVLGITTHISSSMDYKLEKGKTECLLSLCQQVGATEYISGPSARNYIQEDFFQQAGVQLRYMDYSGYPEYEQRYPPFRHNVTILDLLFHKGSEAIKFMKRPA